MTLRRIKDIIHGTEPEFDLKEIIFHQICFVATLGLTLGLGLAIYIRQWDIVLIIALSQLLLTLCYWFSRIMRLFRVAWTLFVLTSYAFYVINYFLNSGLNGTTIVMSFITLSMLFAGTESRNHWKWTLIHGLIFGGLISFELIYGRAYFQDYPSEDLRYVDHIAVYLISIGFFYLIFSLIREAYEKQQKMVNDQRIELSKNRDELEKSYTEVTKLISVIAHDVRNPLASIESYLELLQSETLSKEEKKLFEGELLKMVQNTGHMLDDMVHWSKGQIGAQSINFKLVSLGSWLNMTIESLKGMAHAKGVMLLEDYNGQEKIFCDPNMMTVVIRNLIQNAIKFSPAGKQITFKARKLKEVFWFEIQDEGIGIDADKIPNLFSGQTESELGTSAEKGTGFGLMIVKQYVDLHQGRMEVQSIKGQGSTFSLSIPHKPR